MLAFGSPEIGTALGFVFCTQKMGNIKFFVEIFEVFH